MGACWCGIPECQWHDRDAMSPCEPRPRGVPKVGPGLNVPPARLDASVVTRYGVVEPFLTEELAGPEVEEAERMWEKVREAATEIWAHTEFQVPLASQPFAYDDFSRGFTYADLVRQIAEGHYPDQ